MKKSKHSNYAKVIAFVLIAIVILSAVGFVANGWQPMFDSIDDSGNADKNSGDTDENTNQKDEGDDDIPVVVLPKYYNYLTGLEVTEEAAGRLPISFILDPTLPLYGASASPLTIEFPIENGRTKLLVYSDKATSLGKIGSINPTRGYISNMLKYFGGAMISLGTEDIIGYDTVDTAANIMDLSKMIGYHYTETDYAFTNGDLLRAAISSSMISMEMKSTPRLPFVFVDIDEEERSFESKASLISIMYSSENKTELLYDNESKKYSYLKSGEKKSDMLNASNIEFDNAFILFADSATYETTKGTELILSTVGSGCGYYLTGGTYTAIRWVADTDTMTFYDEYDNKLVINRGTSYISFVKATALDQIEFS